MPSKRRAFVRSSCAFQEKGFDGVLVPSRRRALVIEVHAFHEKDFCMSIWHLLRSVEMVKT